MTSFVQVSYKFHISLCAAHISGLRPCFPRSRRGAAHPRPTRARKLANKKPPGQPYDQTTAERPPVRQTVRPFVRPTIPPTCASTDRQIDRPDVRPTARSTSPAVHHGPAHFSLAALDRRIYPCQAVSGRHRCVCVLHVRLSPGLQAFSCRRWMSCIYPLVRCSTLQMWKASCFVVRNRTCPATPPAQC